MKNIDDLCERNLNLVPYVINKLGLRDKADDYIDIGWIGLVIGCKKYNKDLGYNESTFLTNYIKYYIYNQLRKERRALNGLKEYDILSLDYDINDDTFIDFIPSSFDIDKEFNVLIIKKAIKDCLNYDMTARKTKINHASVIKDYYGIGRKPVKAKEICQKYSISLTTLRDIRNKFRKNLRKRLRMILD